MRRLTRSGRSDQQGAVIVLMSIFIVVVVAMAALVVDVGAIVDERRQLQNGADAGALAVAQSCARGSCAGDVTTAGGLADANSVDDSSAAAVTYPAAKRARVETSTLGGGSNILPYTFGQVISGEKGRTVRASSTAAWAPPSRLTVIPLTISQCNAQRATIGSYTILLFNRPSGPCAGQDLSGAFGWLDGPCPSPMSVGDLISGNPGSSGPPNCLGPLLGTDILVPVFSTTTGTGTNTIYTIAGFAAFRITGYRFGSDQSPTRPCSPPDTCIAGTFIRYVTTSGSGDGSGAGADFGVNRVFLVS